MDLKKRCPWPGSDPVYVEYHDREWGVPIHDDRTWFEFLVLEGAQAGLSWITILKRRETYRRAFCDFDPAQVARFGRGDVERLLHDEGIVRNRAKIDSAIRNARAFRSIQAEFGSFDCFCWRFAGGGPRVNRRRRMADVPASTAESEALSRELRRRGMNFVGPTICYAFMQATGLVNDHLVGCFRHRQLAGRR